MKFTKNYVNVIIDEDHARTGPLSETQLVVCTGDQQDAWEDHYDIHRVRRMGARTIELTDLIDAAIAAGVVIEDLYDPQTAREVLAKRHRKERERRARAASWDREMLGGDTD